MLIVALAGATLLNSWVQVVAMVLSGLCSGLVVRLMAEHKARRLEPAQATSMAVEATKVAVVTVESALAVARAQIVALETRVTELSEQVGELRARLETVHEGREQLRKELMLALIERAKLQRELLAIRERGELIAVPPPDAVLMVDMATGKIVYATDGVSGLLGYTPDSLIGQQVEVLVPRLDRKRHVEQRAEFRAEHRVRHMGTGLDLRALSASGEEIPVDISLHPTGDGRVLVLLQRRQHRHADTRRPRVHPADSGKPLL